MTSSSKSQSSFRGWSLFFCGICMGIADLVPGISGGTIAFILGFYQPLLESIQTLNSAAFKLLIKGQWRAFSQAVAWKFLITLLAGILFAFVCFAHFFHFILAHEIYRIYLYATFLGLVLASFIFCIRKIKIWDSKVILGMCVGALVAYLLTDATWTPVQKESSTFFYGWFVICGMLAVCALLLPGISGSYILTLLGVYPTVIEALVELVNSSTHFSFNAQAFSVLLSLGIGLAIGALGFARLLSWLLRCYPNQCLALLSGFMIGAIRSVWPFESYEYAWHSPLLWQVLLCTIVGFILVFALETVLKPRNA